jgi:voltage-gated potassium channel
MKRHYQVIFETLLSVLILIELLLLILVSIGFFGGIKLSSVYFFGYWDVIIGFLILFDFIFFKFLRGNDQNKWKIIRNNWTYIIAGIPIFFICFNILHLFDYKIFIGLIGIIRIYALIRVLKITSREVSKYPEKTKLDYATVALFLILIFGSLIFFLAERGVNPNVINYESAIWYSIVSMTTTGYGDIVPVTVVGHIIGVIVILTGMGYVSLVTATLAYSFIDLFRKESRKATTKLEKTADELNNNFIIHKEKIDEVLRRMDEIENKIDDINKKKP